MVPKTVSKTAADRNAQRRIINYSIDAIAEGEIPSTPRERLVNATWRSIALPHLRLS